MAKECLRLFEEPRTLRHIEGGCNKSALYTPNIQLSAELLERALASSGLEDQLCLLERAVDAVPIDSAEAWLWC